MGRRRKERPSTSDVPLSLSRRMLAIGAGASYPIFHNILPGAFAVNPILSGAGMLTRGLAWIPALSLGFFAVLSYLRERSRQTDARPGSPHTELTGRPRPPKVPPQLARNAVGSSTPNPPLPTCNTLTSAQAAIPTEPATPQGWTLKAIQLLEWKWFELLCIQCYKQMGFTVKTVSHGADGGISAALYMAGQNAPVTVVQCKAWSKPVKVEQVRVLGGSMLAHKVRWGVFWSLSGHAGNSVQELSGLAGIQLLDRWAVLECIRALAEGK